jgi:hypothetical protein
MKSLKKQLCRVLACAAVVAAGLPAAGAAAFDNGAPDHQSANNLGFAWQADDFSLASGTSVNAISFWSLEADGAFRGSISWSIVGDSAGTPGGTVFASGTQSAITRTGLGDVLGLSEYRNDFSLGSPLLLSAGTYWLVLHNGSSTNMGDPNEFLWETSAANGTLRGVESYDGGATWTGNFNEHAFQVSAVPEPASVLMLAAGMLVVGGLRRRVRHDRFIR